MKLSCNKYYIIPL